MKTKFIINHGHDVAFCGSSAHNRRVHGEHLSPGIVIKRNDEHRRGGGNKKREEKKMLSVQGCFFEFFL